MEDQPESAADFDCLASVANEKPNRKVTEYFLSKPTVTTAAVPNEPAPSLSTETVEPKSIAIDEDCVEEALGMAVSDDEAPLVSPILAIPPSWAMPQQSESSAQSSKKGGDVSGLQGVVGKRCGVVDVCVPEAGLRELGVADTVIGELEHYELTEENVHEFEVLMERAHQAANPDELKGDKTMEDFTRAAVDGDMPSRGAVAQRFRRSMATGGEAATQYSDARAAGREAAKAFRMKWAAHECERLRSTASHTQAWKRVDTTLGTYKTFGKIVLDEGGWTDAAAVKGARELVNKATLLGGQWLMKHPQTGRMVYLHLEFKWAEVMERSWMLFQEATSAQNAQTLDHIEAGSKKVAIGGAVGVGVVGGQQPGSSKNTDAGEGQVVPVAKGRAKPQGKATARAGSGDAPTKKSKLGDDGEADDDVGKKAYAAKLAGATKLKAWFLQVTSRALHLRERVEKEDQWAWARGPLTVGQLDHEMNSIKGCLTEFDNLWLMSSTAELKKKYSKERITVGVAEFTRLEPQVKQLELVVERIIAMHKVFVAS